jgi:hypothetical protein
MLEHDGHNLEQALSRTEADAAATLRAARPHALPDQEANICRLRPLL